MKHKPMKYIINKFKGGAEKKTPIHLTIVSNNEVYEDFVTNFLSEISNPFERIQKSKDSQWGQFIDIIRKFETKSNVIVKFPNIETESIIINKSVWIAHDKTTILFIFYEKPPILKNQAALTQVLIKSDTTTISLRILENTDGANIYLPNIISFVNLFRKIDSNVLYNLSITIPNIDDLIKNARKDINKMEDVCQEFKFKKILLNKDYICTHKKFKKKLQVTFISTTKSNLQKSEIVPKKPIILENNITTWDHLVNLYNTNFIKRPGEIIGSFDMWNDHAHTGQRKFWEKSKSNEVLINTLTLLTETNKKKLTHNKIYKEYLTKFNKLTTARDVRATDEENLKEITENYAIIHKIVLKPHKKLIQIGDIHGNYHAFMVLLEHFHNKEIIDNNLNIINNYVLCFCGDYISRSVFGIETLLLLFILFNKNQDKIYILSGNHESYYNGHDSYKFNIELKDENGFNNEIRKNLLKIFSQLPKGYLFEWMDDNKTIMCAHGSWDTKLVPTARKKINHVISQIYNTDTMYKKNEDEDELSILWGDFKDLSKPDPNKDFEKNLDTTYKYMDYIFDEKYKKWFENGRFIYGKKAIKNFSNTNKHIIAHLSGHQDNSRFAFFPNTQPDASKYMKDPIYDTLYTINDSEKIVNNISGTDIDLTDKLPKEEEHPIFVGISSICPPLKAWGDDATTLAYMSYGFFDMDVTVVPYSVLGQQLQKQSVLTNITEKPDENTAFVDPAGLPFITKLGPKDAGRASAAIYKYIGIETDDAFPIEVKKDIKQTTDAKYHKYLGYPGYPGNKHVIHAVGPDFRSKTKWNMDEPVEKLATTYENILIQFAETPQTVTTLRLLPVSGGIFAGPCKEDIYNMTFKALNLGYKKIHENSKVVKKIKTSKLYMCIFEEKELEAFKEAFGQT